MIDYLTFSLHYSSREEFYHVDNFVQWVASSFENVTEKKSRFPFRRWLVLNSLYDDPMVYLRFAYEGDDFNFNKGFVTFDFLGKYWENEKLPDLDKVFNTLSELLHYPADYKFKIARLDLKYDSTEFDTDYNPLNNEILKFYKGKGAGQPTYYYGTTDNLVRVYDKAAEYLEVDHLRIEQPRLTRFEFQHRDKYLNWCDVNNASVIFRDFLTYDLNRYFGFETYGHKKPNLLSYAKTPDYNLSALIPYCSLMYLAREALGQDEFNYFIDIHTDEFKLNKKRNQFLKENASTIIGICDNYLREFPRPQTEAEFNEINIAYRLYDLHNKLNNL